MRHWTTEDRLTMWTIQILAIIIGFLLIMEWFIVSLDIVVSLGVGIIASVSLQFCTFHWISKRYRSNQNDKR